MKSIIIVNYESNLSEPGHQDYLLQAQVAQPKTSLRLINLSIVLLCGTSQTFSPTTWSCLLIGLFDQWAAHSENDYYDIIIFITDIHDVL